MKRGCWLLLLSSSSAASFFATSWNTSRDLGMWNSFVTTTRVVEALALALALAAAAGTRSKRSRYAKSAFSIVYRAWSSTRMRDAGTPSARARDIRS